LFSNFFSSNKIINLDSESFERKLSQDENAVILDVRTQQEYNEYRIPNSLLIDIYRPTFLNEIEKLDRTKNYYVYCHSGARSYQAAAKMVKLGFDNLFNLSGGIASWYGEIEES